MQKKSSLLGILDVKGFTLIELLVVVLIIGILAAVALPQYQKAVEKSRGAQALVVLKSVGQAIQTYWTASGTYPNSFDELDVDIPWTGNTKWYNAGATRVLDTRSNADWSLQMYKDTAGTSLGLYMGRISGKYKGGAFLYSAITTNELGTGQITCHEKVKEGIVFEQPAGSYCEKIWKGTYLTGGGSGTSMRTYTLP